MPVRLAVGLGLWFGIGIAVSSLLSVVVTGRTPLIDLRTGYEGSILVSAIGLVVGAIATPIAIILAARYVDRRAIADFGLHVDRTWWRDLAVGLLIGAGLMTGIFLVELAMGWVTITGRFSIGGVPKRYFLPWLLLSIGGYVAGSILEELLHRGFLLRNVAEGAEVGPIGASGAVGIAIALTSGLFAVAHATAPNATAISTASIALAGVLLGLGFAVTGQLALPIGIHIAWNLFEGNLYGFPISGSGTTSILEIDQRGPALFTGGAFGPEAGLLGVLAILLGMALTVWWARRTRDIDATVRGLTIPTLRD